MLVSFIRPEAREWRRSRSNQRWLGGASRCDGFGFDSALRGRINEGAELEREWKGGGGLVASGPVRRRWPEAHGGAWHSGAGQRRRRLGHDRGRRKALSGPAWAGLGRASRAAVGPVWEFPKKRSWAAMVSWAENQKGCRKNPFQFFKQRFDLKSQGFKYF